MSDKPLPLWAQIMTWLRLYVASFAMKFCGCEHLYWTNPPLWEAYMKTGEPYDLSDDEEKERLREDLAAEQAYGEVLKSECGTNLARAQGLAAEIEVLREVITVACDRKLLKPKLTERLNKVLATYEHIGDC